MSLHRKIVWLFIGIAIVPLLVFAGVARHQTLAVADFAAETSLLADVSSAGRILGQEAAVAEATLRALAGLDSATLTQEFLEAVLRSDAGPQPEGFQHLEVMGGGGQILAATGEVAERVICRANRLSALVRVEVPLPDDQGVVAGSYWPGGGEGIHVATGLWVHDSEGALILASPCGREPDPPLTALPPESSSGILGTGEMAEREQESAAFAIVESLGWTVLATGSSRIRAPLARFFRSYWLFVLALAGATLLAFSILVRQVTGSLADLTRAVEQVASGDMRPWLPTPRNDEVGRLTLAFSDMTDRLRHMVDQVDRAGRLAVLGKLSAYLAHEIRNPLSSVKMNLQRLRRWRAAGEIPERCGEAIEVSLREVDRLSAAVSNILQLSPGGDKPMETVAVHDVVTEAGRLLDSEFNRRGVQLRWDLNAATDRVMGHPGQLKGVIINLMLNALDAQPEGGQLLIGSNLQPAGPDRSGPRLELRFRDQGHGVPPGIRDRIFEPFFTTKETGSGIGLAVAGQTIRDHGGDFFLEDGYRYDGGAEFVVSLPLAAVAPEGRRETVRQTVAPWMEDAREANSPGGGQGPTRG